MKISSYTTSELNAAVMSRPFEFRGRGLAWEIYRDQIIFLTRSPLFFSAKAEEI
jgi:hypothetical protein